MTLKTLLLIVLAVAFAIVRCLLPAHPVSPAGSYEAFAHLFVGGLIGAWIVSRDRAYGFLALALSLFELGAFTFQSL